MLNRRAFLEASVGASALALLHQLPVSASSATSTPDSTAWNLSVHTDPKMWSAIQAHTRPGDRYRTFFPMVNIPWSMRSWGFPDLATLATAGDQKLANYSAVHLDGEYKVVGQASAEAPKIRAFIDAYNLRHPTLKITWEAYYLNTIIDREHSGILQYPDITAIGASRWQQSTSLIQTHAKPYMDLIRAAGRIPAVRLCDYVSPQNGNRFNLTASALAAQIQAVVDPPPVGMGITHIEGFYFYTAPSTTFPAAAILLRG